MSDKKVSSLPGLEDIGGFESLVALNLVGAIAVLEGGNPEGFPPDQLYKITGEDFRSYVKKYGGIDYRRAQLNLLSGTYNAGYQILFNPVSTCARMFFIQVGKSDGTDLSAGWTTLNLNGVFYRRAELIPDEATVTINSICTPISVNGGTLAENIFSRIMPGTDIILNAGGDDWPTNFSIPFSFYIPESLSCKKIDLSIFFDCYYSYYEV